MKNFLAFLMIVCLHCLSTTLKLAYGQSPIFQWAKSIPTTAITNATSIAIDNAGNTYTTGYFEGTTDFDPGAAVYNLTTPLFTDCIYVSKLDASGNFVWAKKLGSVTQFQNSSARSIAIDTNGNAFITGIFVGTIDCDPSNSVFNLTNSSTSFFDVFIVKLTSSGNFSWAKRIGSSTGDDQGYSIAIDPTGNVLTTGSFEDTVDFDPSSLGFSYLISAGSSDIFISKLSSAGNFVWAKRMGGTSQDDALSIGIDASGNVYTTGWFNGTSDFDPGVATYNLTSIYFDIFISKLDASGNFVWAKSLTGENFNSSIGRCIKVDQSSNVYITGEFAGNVDFNPGSSAFNMTSGNINGNTFILKLGSSGNFIWAKALIGSSADNAGSSIGVDISGNVYTTGFLRNSVDFDPGTSTYPLVSDGFQSDIYFLKLNSLGNFVWAKKIGSTFSDFGNSLILDGSGNIYATGVFGNTVDFDPGPGIANLTSTGTSWNSYILKWNDNCIQPLAPTNTTSTSNLNICSGHPTTLTATGTGTLSWYTTSTGGVYLGAGNSFTSPALYTNTTYYVQDSLCQASTRTAINIIINPSPPVMITGGTTTVCAGNPVTLTATGANTYSWSAGITNGVAFIPLSTATYTVTGTSNNGCTNTYSMLVTVNPLPEIGITATSSSVCAGSPTTLTATGIGVTSFIWNPGNISGSSITVTPAVTTTYTVTGTNAFGCTKTSTRTITVNSCSLIYTLKLYIEGYYKGSGLMDHVMLNQNITGANTTQTDTIFVELRNPSPPFAVEYSMKTIVNTNGNAICNFPNTGTYYIAVKHRNGLQTWSKNAVSIGPFANAYNFTTAATKAFGNNMTEVAPGVWAFYSGDLNKDDNIDLLDLTDLESDINNFVFGYFATDMNGDGNVDLLDIPLLEENINNFIFSVHL